MKLNALSTLKREPMATITETALLSLLQLTSPALPVGAYSYSEGLETIVERQLVTNAAQLQAWLIDSLSYGSIRLDAAIMLRAHRAWLAGDLDRWMYWNDWLSAARESEELQQQNWQMGRSLVKLLRDLEPQLDIPDLPEINFSTAMAIGTAHWQIDEQTAVLGYLHSWVSNSIGAGIKLIPLGQTAGQRLLMALSPIAIEVAQQLTALTDDDLSAWSWSLSLASMTHETQYSRLFRS